MADSLYGAIEAGGTKFICATGSSATNIVSQIQIPTTSPDETLNKAISFFNSQPPLQAIGIATFGPVDLDKQSKTYGYITTTPKPGWQNTDIVGAISNALKVPVSIDTDVNCAALGEQLYGAAKGLDSMAYITVGTGIGVGCISGNHIFQGLSHTEMGHLLIPRLPDDQKPSACPYHNSCLEGLASGTALHKRWGVAAELLKDKDAWEQEAQYLAYGLVNVIVSTMPKRIVSGGSVMNHPGLIDSVRAKVVATLNGYLNINELTNEVNDFIVLPGLGSTSGVTGALVLASN